MPNPYLGLGLGPRDLSNYDDVSVPDLELQPKVGPLIELGQTGIKRAAGIIDEEFLPALRGRKAVQVFTEMSKNDPIVGSLLFTIDKLLRQVTWRVESADNTPGQSQASDFVEECMDDMSHTWDDMIADILTCIVYGWSWHEIVYKKRVGPWESDPKKKSKYTDGKIGWRKIPIRSQETMLRWIFDDHGGIKGLVQLAPPYYQTTVLPIERSLLFRISTAKGNPEGVSLLRTAYRPWFFKKRLEEFEAIGVERDLAGMPVAKIPASYMDAPTGSREQKVFAAFKKLVSNVRRDEHDGLVLPIQYDRNTKQPLFDFELLSAGGSRTFDTNALITRYEQRILMTTLADFILVGHEGTGSYALHVDKTGIFRAALNSITSSIADTFNRHAIPRLFALNGWKLDTLPKIVPNNVDPPDLTQLSSFMAAMGNLGMEWFPDPDLEKFLREVAGLPELPEDVLAVRRQMAQTQNAMSYADQQFQFLGMQQKAELMGQGYSPDQADMAQQSPNDDQAAQQANQQAGAQQVLAGADPSQDPQAQQASAEAEQQRGLQLQAATEQGKANDHQRALEIKDRDEKSKAADHKRALELARTKSEANRQAFLRNKAQARRPASKQPERGK